jgi:hypothetical protein
LVYRLEPVAEANHDTPILQQVAQQLYRRVGATGGFVILRSRNGTTTLS